MTTTANPCKPSFDYAQTDKHESNISRSDTVYSEWSCGYLFDC